MDMNDILNQWDKLQADKVKKQKEMRIGLWQSNL